MNEHPLSGSDVPDPQFAARLEWQVRTALRRTDRFAEPVAASRSPWRTLRLAVAVAGALAIGAGSVLATQRWEESRLAELVRLRAELRLELEQARLAALEQAHARTAELAAAGFAPSSHAGCARRELERGQAHFHRYQLDLEEVGASGKEADDRLGAPRLHGRDFVSERLDLDRSSALREIEWQTGELVRMRELFAAGVLPSHELRSIETELAIASSALDAIDQRLDLRRRFLQGLLSESAIELEELRLDALGSIAIHQRTSNLLRTRLDELQSLRDRGLAATGEWEAASLSLLEAETNLRIAEAELELVHHRMNLGR